MHKPIIIGVTGSKGKTSCCYTLNQYLKYLGYSCCMMSSTRYEDDDFVDTNWSNNLDASKMRYYINKDEI